MVEPFFQAVDEVFFTSQGVSNDCCDINKVLLFCILGFSFVVPFISSIARVLIYALSIIVAHVGFSSLINDVWVPPTAGVRVEAITVSKVVASVTAASVAIDRDIVVNIEAWQAGPATTSR